MTRIATLSLAALAAALIAPTARAQQTNTQAQPGARPGAAANANANANANAGQVGTAGQAPVADNLFAQAAAIGGLAEVTLAQLGAQKATDPELKRFSQQMIDEHSRMNQELTTLAAQKQMALPRGVDPRAQFCAQSLSGLSGEEFDRCYAKAQLVMHMESVATFEAEAQRGQDPQIKALAARSLPHIQEHLRTIKPIAMRYEQEKPSTGTRTGTGSGGAQKSDRSSDR